MLIPNVKIDGFFGILTILFTVGFCIFFVVSGIFFVRQSFKYRCNLLCKISSIGLLISTILVDLGMLNILFNFAPDTKTETSLVNVLGLIGMFTIFIFEIMFSLSFNSMQLPDPKSGRKSKTN